MLVFQRAWVAVFRGLFYGICFGTLMTSVGWCHVLPDQPLEKPQGKELLEDSSSNLYQSYQNIEIPTAQGTISLPSFLSSIPHEPTKTFPLTKYSLLKDENSGFGSSQPLTVVSEINSRNAILRFDWGEKAPALAVVKGVGRWWIVFDDTKLLSLPDIKENPLPGVLNLETIPTKDGIVIQLIAHSDFTPVVSREGNIWQISLKSQVLPVAQIAPVQLPQTKEEGLVVGLKEPGKEVRFTDPHTGYSYVVFPSHQVGFGVVHGQAFPEFSVLASTQGVGFQLVKDDLIIQTSANQASVRHPEGLAVTLPQERGTVRALPLPMGLFIDAKDLDCGDRQLEINHELLDLPHDQHGPGELELAWLMLSYGQASKAMGYLVHLAKERPSIANVPLFQVLQGVGNLLLNQLSDAEAYLQCVHEEPEAQVWLSLLKALQQPHQFTSNPILMAHLRSQFQTAKTLLKGYPQPLHDQMLTLILFANVATEDTETLISFMDQEMSHTRSVGQGEVFKLAKSRVLMSQNKPDAALQMLGELMEKAASPLVRAIARFDYIVYRLKTDMMKEEDALSQLENLRSDWREKWFGQQVAVYLDGRKANKKFGVS